MTTTLLSAGQWLTVLAIFVPLALAVLLAAWVLINRKPAPPKPPRPVLPASDGPGCLWWVPDPFTGGMFRLPPGIPGREGLTTS